MPKVLAIHSGKREAPGGCELYRVTMPLSYLKQHWGIVDWFSFSEFHAGYESFASVSEDAGMKYLDDVIAAYDLFIFARTIIRNSPDAYESSRILLQKIRDANKRVIYEVDDDLTNINRFVANGDSPTFASWCDAITVTTPHLAKTMQKLTNRPCYVLPNMLDPIFWKTPRKVNLVPDKLRIVLSGSSTHYKDWEILAEPFKHVAEDYENVRILIGSFHAPYFEDVKNIEFVPSLEYQKYVELIKNADIILAPVIPDDEFNLHKSPIKALEGMGATRELNGNNVGAAVIATNNEVYRLAITNNKDGLLVEHTAEAWEKALRELIEDEKKRHELQYAGYATAWKRFDLEENWNKWALTYLKVLQSPMNTKEMGYEQRLKYLDGTPDLPDGYKRQSRPRANALFPQLVSNNLIAAP